MTRAASLLLLAILGLSCLGMGKMGKRDRHVVSFHVQAADTVSRSRVFEHPAGSGYSYEKSPVVHWRQIKAFSPITGDDGAWGAVFRLSNGGRNALAAAASQHQGRFLLCVVRGKPRGIVKIDRVVGDGILVAWEKLTAEDLELFDKKFARIESIDNY